MTNLALNMIVGPNESGLLRRCLTSYNAKEMFDEIVIVNTSNDESVTSVAKEFTDKVFYYQWITDEYPFGNFGGARNFAAENTISDKIWWLDADDVCLDEYKEKLIESIKLIKDDQYKDVMIWRMPYTVVLDESGKPDVWFKRERVFDRKTIHWRRSIHEVMFPSVDMVRHASINNMYNTHLPVKPNYVSAVRNVAMLENELKNDPDDIQTKYFLGRDYLFVGKTNEGIEILNSILSELSAGYDMLYSIAIELAWFYSYGCINPHPVIDQFKKDNVTKVEGYCRLALSFTYDYAEPYVLIGDVYLCNGLIDEASKMYRIALNKKLGVGMYQTQPLYCEIPSDRLSHIFEHKSMYGMSIHYNEVAKRANMNIKEYQSRKRSLVEKLIQEINDECKDQSA